VERFADLTVAKFGGNVTCQFSTDKPPAPTHSFHSNQCSTLSGVQIPIEQVARISFSRGPAMIRDEDGALTGYV